MSIFRLRDESSGEGVEGELMHGIKVPQQDFSLKMQVELMHEGGGVFVGHYGIFTTRKSRLHACTDMFSGFLTDNFSILVLPLAVQCCILSQ